MSPLGSSLWGLNCLWKLLFSPELLSFSMIQPQMLFLISWSYRLLYQGTEDMEQPIKYHHIFSALGKAIQETDCVYISHLWRGCISWKQCRIFPSLYSQRRINNKNPSHTATQNKQKNVVSKMETLSFMMNMHVGELSQSLWTIWPKAVLSGGLSSSWCSGLLQHVHEVYWARTGPGSGWLCQAAPCRVTCRWSTGSWAEWGVWALPMSQKACIPGSPWWGLSGGPQSSYIISQSLTFFIGEMSRWD